MAVIGAGPAGLVAANQLNHKGYKVTAVSYTHLDVYKRQIRRCIIAHVSGDDEERIELGNKLLFAAEELHESVDIVWHQPGVLPVSYTHLDVYKRQHPDCAIS